MYIESWHCLCDQTDYAQQKFAWGWLRGEWKKSSWPAVEGLNGLRGEGGGGGNRMLVVGKNFITLSVVG